MCFKHLSKPAIGLAFLAFIGFSCTESLYPEDSLTETALVEEDPNKKIIPNQFVVVLKSNTMQTVEMYQARVNPDVRDGREALYESFRKDMKEEVQQAFRLREEQVLDVYGAALVGFSAQLDEAQLAELRTDERVDFIEEDFEIELSYSLGMPSYFDIAAPMQTGQVTPWGITRIGGAVNAAGLNRWAWVIDSGIQLNHPDLNVNTQFARSFVPGLSSATDQNGHGTHVAGTIAAINNNFGVIGVAAGATVVPIRVFGATGGSANSVIIAGIDYTAQNALANDVANLSLGGPASLATDNAVRNLANQGVFVAIAAGNEAQNANNVSPARATGTRLYTVSAFDINNNFASFSNFGNPPIIISAPGVQINSTWINSGYRAINGTSMATPHVAGILLANNGTLRWSGFVNNDPDGNPDRMARR